MKSLREQASADHRRKVDNYCAGGSPHAKGGKVTPAEKRVIEKAVHEHEDHEHGGKRTHLKLKDGGHVHGHEPHARADRKARGGAAKKPGTKVNVVVAGGGKQPVPVPVPVAGGPGAPGPGQMPPRPPMAAAGQMPGGPGMPPGAMPRGPMKRGGAAKKAHGGEVGGPVPHLTGGAGGGRGRLEKTEAEAKRMHRRD